MNICNLIIHNTDQSEPAMLAAVMQRMAQHAPQARSIDVFCNARTPMVVAEWKDPGWCEYVCVIKYRSGGQLTIGCIQRGPGQPTEFHT